MKLKPKVHTFGTSYNLKRKITLLLFLQIHFKKKEIKSPCFLITIQKTKITQMKHLEIDIQFRKLTRL